MKTISDLWNDFSLVVIPLNAPPVQRAEMRRAFYAGAQAMLGLSVGVLGKEGEEVSEDEAVARLGKLREELGQFAIDVRAGRA